MISNATLMTPRRPGTATPETRSGTTGMFFAVLWRDVFVTARELPPYIAQIVLQPLFMLFVFGTVLGALGYTDPSYAQILFPGVIGLNAFITALQNTGLPLVVDLSATRELEDRLLAPLPVWLVAVEKMTFGALKGVVAALVMTPIGFLLLPAVSWSLSGVPGAIVLVLLGASAGSAVGLVIGTAVRPKQINIVFTVLLTPLLFTGSVQFTWMALDALRWYQMLCALNPLTYVTEGLRSQLIPHMSQSIPLWIDITVLIFACFAFGSIGVRGFIRRASD
ncbi:ABC-2 type transport system permease protein [Saccharopolyspora lacisalsi]|uniref:Transport permease protein n=1 Tax=Halosaccharopolyspora lacisalsi TaxID=1000566 RepID=A0A839E2K7_9PSEU|nr:ABC transporter permease [Halosaccharopolyspora lacisalsi]MBA8827513.1 ABC-2 type transport system permease protein [Halosaccharopolyspora lacisalsi]